jgi:uncharacterized protein (TIGR03435 family)
MLDGRATSRRCATPITVGWFAPVLILPSGWPRWPAAKLNAVLTHEREHARRHDPLVQWLALLNRAVFWFHPLSWWLERRLATLAEEACDAAVLAAGHSPQDYSDYLLDMARSLVREGRRLDVVGMAMPGSGLPRRMRQILEGLPMQPVSRTRVICTIAFCTMSSVVFAAGTLVPRRPASASGQATAGKQEPAGQSVKVDVASIKPCPGLPPPGGGRGLPPSEPMYSPSYVHWDCVSLAELIDQIYAGPDTPLLNVLARAREDRPKRVRGGPSWVESDRFTIEAKISGDSNKPGMQRAAYYVYMRAVMNPALEALLADRFQLKVHRATEQQSMYALTLAKGGLNRTLMKPTAPDECYVWKRGMPAADPPGFEGKPRCGDQSGGERGGIQRSRFTGATLPGLATSLAGQRDRFVIDKTGIEGRFTFVLEYAPDDLTSTPGNGPTLDKALETLGLKLEPTKGPAEYLVIDRAEKPRPDTPSDAFDPPARARGPRT